MDNFCCEKENTITTLNTRFLFDRQSGISVNNRKKTYNLPIFESIKKLEINKKKHDGVLSLYINNCEFIKTEYNNNEKNYVFDFYKRIDNTDGIFLDNQCLKCNNIDNLSVRYEDDNLIKSIKITNIKNEEKITNFPDHILTINDPSGLVHSVIVQKTEIINNDEPAFITFRINDYDYETLNITNDKEFYTFKFNNEELNEQIYKEYIPKIKYFNQEKYVSENIKKQSLNFNIINYPVIYFYNCKGCVTNIFNYITYDKNTMLPMNSTQTNLIHDFFNDNS